MIRSRSWLGLGLAAAVLGAAGRGVAQSEPRFQVGASGPAQEWSPVVAAAGLLQDGALRSALESGLPLRFRLRVELWRPGLFDRLVDAEEIHLALHRDPLEGQFLLENGRSQERYATLTDAQRVIEQALQSSLRPPGRGRYYYLGSLEVETLSLSDLEELRRWLRGEVQPAVQGRSSPGRALERGLRRVFVRVIGLPTRRYEDRSATFTVR